MGERYRAPSRLVGAQARIQKTRSALILTCCSLLMTCLMFPPVNWGWLGYVCLVPWLVCVCTSSRAKFIYLLSFLFGLGYFAINIRWMIPVTWEGYTALCVYFSLFFPLAAWPIRHMHQRHGVSVALSAAIVWTAAEYLRSNWDLAFPWLLLGHTQYKFLSMIQIADIGGVYAVSFLVAMVNGWITDLLIQPILIWRSDQITRLPLGTLSLAVVLAGTLIYGWAQGSPASFVPGPRVAVVQHDFAMYIDERGWRTSPDLIFRSYLSLGEQAAREKPDLLVFPETVMTGYINDEFIQATPGQLDEIRQRRFPWWSKEDVVALQAESRRIRNAFQKLADTTGVAIVLGCSAMEWMPTGLPPRAEGYNSAFLLVPGGDRPAARYDKNHLVLFGEYVPFRYTYHWLYQWLNSLTPFGRQGVEYSLGAGSGFEAFEFVAASQSGRRYRIGTPICYEEIMPYIGREFTRSRNGAGPPGKNIDMLICISNDGWFLHTAELEQHLAGAVFRAIENRISIARSVNTGASSFVHPNGRIVDRVELAPDMVQQLPPVRVALEKCRDVAARISIAGGPAKISEFSASLSELLTSLQPLGRPYNFMEERLYKLMLPLLSPDLKRREAGLQALREQLVDDLTTVDRWRTQPGTAPGFRISQMPVDARLTLYARWGDWFSQGAVALTGMMLLDWILRRLWRKMSAKD